MDMKWRDIRLFVRGKAVIGSSLRALPATKLVLELFHVMVQELLATITFCFTFRYENVEQCSGGTDSRCSCRPYPRRQGRA